MGAPPDAAPLAAADASLLPMAADTATDTPAIDPFLHDHATGGHPIGHTSVAFKLTFAGGGAAAYKPASTRGPTRWRGEVAAYRMALALGLSNVPPAFAHPMAKSELRAGLDAPGQALVDAEAIADQAGQVEGALIPWIKDLEMPPLERDPLFTSWTTSLHHDAPMPTADDAALAAQMSTLVVFDLLDGNWDRWSGANVGRKKGTSTYLYIDNDGAFFPHPPVAALTKGGKRLEQIDRFSKSFVARLRSFDPNVLGAGSRDAGLPAASFPPSSDLPPEIVHDVAARQAKVLATIDAKIKQYGADAVLAFP